MRRTTPLNLEPRTPNPEPFSDKESPETFYIFHFHAFHEKEVKSL